MKSKILIAAMAAVALLAVTTLAESKPGPQEYVMVVPDPEVVPVIVKDVPVSTGFPIVKVDGGHAPVRVPNRPEARVCTRLCRAVCGRWISGRYEPPPIVVA